MAAINMTLIIKAIAKAHIKLFRTHVCRFCFWECTREEREKEKKPKRYVLKTFGTGSALPDAVRLRSRPPGDASANATDSSLSDRKS